MNRLPIVRAAERAYGSWPWRSRCLIGRNVVRHERSRCSATPAAATVLFSDLFLPSGRFSRGFPPHTRREVASRRAARG